MTDALAASESPNAPRFAIITKAIRPGGTDPDTGRRRFLATASSTIVDRSGDEITLPALEQLAKQFREGITIYMDHDFEHVEKAFGLSDSAEIVQRSIDPVTNTPIWDLDIGGVVNVPNPKAVQLADSIDGGYAKFGASVTAFVRKHSRKSTGGMLISGLEAIEASIVGVPDNQRSWAQKAVTAVKSFKYPTEEGNVSDPIIEKGTAAPDPEVAEPVEGADDDNEKIDDPASEPVIPETVSEDGQASEQASGDPETPAAETPETASSDDSSSADADPQFEKAYEPGEVVELVKQSALLVTEIGRLREENAGLRAQVESYKTQAGAITTEVDAATKVIEKVLAMPLRPRTAGYVEDFAKTHELFAETPVIAEYLSKRSHLSHE